MSKMDALRAMREAHYGQAETRKAKPAAATRAPAARAAKPSAAKQAETAPRADTEPTEALCGHRAISGRTCTREQGHSAKSHRYS